MQKMKHPRFLGFLWKYHVFYGMQKRPCTLKCDYCDKTRHEPEPSDFIDLHEEDLPMIYRLGCDDYEYRKCKICNKLERRLLREGGRAGSVFGKWEECPSFEAIKK